MKANDSTPLDAASVRKMIEDAVTDPQKLIQLLLGWQGMHDRMRHLKEHWIALGAWSFQTGSSVAKVDSETRAKFRAKNGPAVCTMEEFKAITRAEFMSLTMAPLAILPRASMQCRGCGNKFEIRDFPDLHSTDDTTLIDVSNKAGQTLGTILRNKRKDKRRQWVLIRSGSSHEVLRKTEDPDKPYSATQVDLTYVIRPGDHLHFYCFEYWHPGCWDMHLEEKMRKKFTDCLREAGFTGFRLTAIKNEYGSASYRGPWFQVILDEGSLITIGWRKRVIHIDYKATKFQGKISGSDETTTSDSYCHAWGYDKATEYLSRLRDGVFGVMA